MKFGPVPVGDAAGAILAHSVRLPSGTIRKGRVLTAADVDALRSAGTAEVVVARLSPSDIHEDAAAAQLAAAVAGDGVRVERPFTGRANLYAEYAGVFVVDPALVDRINAVDAAITIATLAEYAPVAAGQMVATVKIIPFATDSASLTKAVEIANASPVLSVAAFHPRKVGLIATTLPSLKPSVMDKTRRLLEARLEVAGATLLREDRVAHEANAVAAALTMQSEAGADLLVVFGASAVVDINDVIPAAIVLAGGRVVRFGMPVDPGNLLVLGDLDGTPVVGAPGCARSPSENGFDWVLNRLLAGLEVTNGDIAGLGVGGLLMEIVSRPQPREGATAPSNTPQIAAVVLAAGQSRRMGGPNKLLATLDGKPLVRLAVEAAVASRADPVIVVTGHRAPEIEAALDGLSVTFAHNPDYADGLSTSLRTGIRALPAGLEGAVVLLSDMPGVDAETLDRLISAFDPAEGAEIVVPTWQGKRGNPVLWASRFFKDLMAVSGDAGGRHLIGANSELVVEIEVGAAVALDVDTPQALAEIGGTLD